jgi:hypothetical protein
MVIAYIIRQGVNNLTRRYRMKKKYEFRPSGWQLEADSIKTENVQYWRNGIMITGRMLKAEAQNLVKAGHAFVMCEQAIGCMEEGISLA